ncbi:MAG: hypothetical protein GY950_11595, partial [bacterium]|nr:hypothetical protein [bacterium]
MIDIMTVAKKIGTLLAGRAYKSLERNHKVLKFLKALEIGELKEDVES